VLYIFSFLTFWFFWAKPKEHITLPNLVIDIPSNEQNFAVQTIQE